MRHRRSLPKTCCTPLMVALLLTSLAAPAVAQDGPEAPVSSDQRRWPRW